MPVDKKALRKDKRYEVTAVVGRDANGKPIRKHFYGKSQREAKAKLKAYQEQAMLAADAGIMTLDRWCNMWLKTYATGGRRNIANTESILRRFRLFMGEGIKLQDVRPAHIQAYAREQAGKTKSHVDKVRRTLSNVFKAAVENDYILKSPCTGIVWESVRTGSHEALEPYLIKLITDYWRIHSAGVWAMFMLYAGLRPSEAFALTREHISDGFIHVTDGSHFEHSKLVIVPGQVKTEAGQRDIPVLRPLEPVLSVLPATGLVCLSATGKPVSEAAMRSNWHTFWLMLEDLYNGVVPRGAGRRTDKLPQDWKPLPKVTMYDLRHTYCTMLYEADVDVKTAQYLMGHAAQDMTLKVYTHLTERKKMRSFDKLYAYFENDTSSKVSSESPKQPGTSQC